MTKLWRITNKGNWPEFDQDVLGDNIDNAIKNFEEYQKKQGSIATREQIIKIELIGDTKTSEDRRCL